MRMVRKPPEEEVTAAINRPSGENGRPPTLESSIKISRRVCPVRLSSQTIVLSRGHAKPVCPSARLMHLKTCLTNAKLWPSGANSSGVRRKTLPSYPASRMSEDVSKRTLPLCRSMTRIKPSRLVNASEWPSRENAELSTSSRS